MKKEKRTIADLTDADWVSLALFDCWPSAENVLLVRKLCYGLSREDALDFATHICARHALMPIGQDGKYFYFTSRRQAPYTKDAALRWTLSLRDNRPQ